MTILKTIVLALLLPLVAFAAKPITTQELEIPQPSTPQEYIKYYANLYNTDPNVLLSVAKCESQFKQSTRGDNGLAVGIFQYHRGTWTRMSKLYGQELDINSVADQAKLTAFIYSNYPSIRNEWSTYVAIKKGGTYSFYSTLLKQNFNVKCSISSF